MLLNKKRFFLSKYLHNSKKCSTFASEFPVVPDASQTIGCRFYSTLAFKFGRKGTTFLQHTQVLRQESSEFVKFAFKILYFGNCIVFLNVGIILEKVWKWCVLIKNEIILKKSVEIFVYIKNF